MAGSVLGTVPAEPALQLLHAVLPPTRGTGLTCTVAVVRKMKIINPTRCVQMLPLSLCRRNSEARLFLKPPGGRYLRTRRGEPGR